MRKVPLKKENQNEELTDNHDNLQSGSADSPHVTAGGLKGHMAAILESWLLFRQHWLLWEQTNIYHKISDLADYIRKYEGGTYVIGVHLLLVVVWRYGSYHDTRHSTTHIPKMQQRR